MSGERNERMTRILGELKSPLMWVQGENDAAPSIHDYEGDCIAVLPKYLVPVLDAVSDSEAGAIIEAIGDCIAHARRESFHVGSMHGRDAAISLVHEILGIDRICAAISERNS